MLPTKFIIYNWDNNILFVWAFLFGTVCICLPNPSKKLMFCFTLPLPAPDHGRNVDTHARFVQHDFKPRCSIVDRDAASAVRADQKLMTLLVRVLASYPSGRDAGNDKISFWAKWKIVLEFTDRQVAARILHRRKPVKNNPAHANRRDIHLRWLLLRHIYLARCGV